MNKWGPEGWQNCYNCCHGGDGDEINDLGHCWKHNGEPEFIQPPKNIGCNEWEEKENEDCLIKNGTLFVRVPVLSQEEAKKLIIKPSQPIEINGESGNGPVIIEYYNPDAIIDGVESEKQRGCDRMEEHGAAPDDFYWWLCCFCGWNTPRTNGQKEKEEKNDDNERDTVPRKEKG